MTIHSERRLISIQYQKEYVESSCTIMHNWIKIYHVDMWFKSNEYFH